MYLFHKNCVITGLLDSYCLPCEVHFGTEDDIRAHILELRHLNNLSSTSYVAKHKNDRIRKVPQGYYCEYCNKLFFTAFTMGLHVNDVEHRKNKNVQWVREQGDAVIVLNKLVVDGDSWHGLVDGACALCNSDYLDKEAHKSLPTHLLKLIQSSVELHTSGSIYRKEGDIFHCLICNAVFPLTSFGTHFHQPDHTKFYNKCCESFETKAIAMNLDANGSIASNINIETSDEKDDDKKEITEPKSTTDTVSTKEVKNESLSKKVSVNHMETDEKFSGEQSSKYQSVSERITNKVKEDRSKGKTSLKDKQDTVPKEDNEKRKENDEEIARQVLTNLKQSFGNVAKNTNEDQLTSSASERFPAQRTTESLQEDKRQLLSKKEGDNSEVKDKENAENLFTNNKQTSQNQTTKSSEKHLELKASRGFHTQKANETVPESKQETVPKKKSENRKENNDEIARPLPTNLKQPFENVAKNTNEDQLTSSASERFPVQRTTESLQEDKRELLSKKEGDNSEVKHKENAENQFTNNKQTLPPKRSENDEVGDKEISGKQPINNNQTIQDAAKNTDTYNRNPEIIHTQKLQGLKCTKIIKEISKEKRTCNSQTAAELKNKSNENKSDKSEKSYQTQKTPEKNSVEELKPKTTSKKKKVKLIADANKIRYKEGCTTAYCTICCTKISSSRKHINRHVGDATHKMKAEQVFKYVSNVMPTHKFVEHILFIETESIVTEVVINNSYCVTLGSYFLMTKCDSYIRCHICQLNFNFGLLDDHQSSETHNGLLRNIPVLCSLSSEFVREVQVGYYHCGFCNTFQVGCQALQDHCNSEIHSKQKSIASQKLHHLLCKNTK